MAGMESPIEKQDRMKFTEFTVDDIMPNVHEVVLEMNENVPKRRDTYGETRANRLRKHGDNN